MVQPCAIPPDRQSSSAFPMNHRDRLRCRDRRRRQTNSNFGKAVDDNSRRDSGRMLRCQSARLNGASRLWWWGCVLASLLSTMADPAFGQPAATPPSTAIETVATAAVPLAEINSESESVLAFARDLSGNLSADTARHQLSKNSRRSPEKSTIVCGRAARSLRKFLR